MKININNITRDMTPEEIAEYEGMIAETLHQEPTTEERIAELEEALELILLGATE